MIDTAGPWEVFQDVEVDALVGTRSPFELYTVGPSEEILTMTGGLKVKPNYSIANAPQPNVIVVPAQRATDETRAWLRTAAAKTDVTLSVCTGAFQLARAGLLNGVAATTHHDFLDAFAKEFPTGRIAPRLALRRQRPHRDRGRADVRNRHGVAHRRSLLRRRDGDQDGTLHGVLERGVEGREE